MRYVCLIYDDEKKLGAMSKDEADGFMKAYFDFTEQIRASGNLIAGEALQPVHTTTSLRRRSGKLSTTDGPFMETKEQLGGFYLIEAGNLDEARKIAARIPSVETGTIEVRPVVDFSKQQEPPRAGKQAATAAT